MSSVFSTFGEGWGELVDVKVRTVQRKLDVLVIIPVYSTRREPLAGI